MSNQQKTALITGASKGLGFAMATALAQTGWQLIINGRNRDRLEAARASFATHTNVTAIPGDINDWLHRQALTAAVANIGGLDLIFNNAGMLGPSPQPNLLDYPLETLGEVFQTNVIAQLGIVQALQNELRDGGIVINMTSDAAVEAYPGWGGYGAAKAAFEQLSAILAAENPGWRVYAVDPGDMQTDMHQAAFPGEDISDRGMPEDSVPGFMALIDGDLPSGRYIARHLVSAAV